MQLYLDAFACLNTIFGCLTPYNTNIDPGKPAAEVSQK